MRPPRRLSPWACWLLAGFSASLWAQVPTAWEQRYTGAGAGYDEANAVAVDKSGNVYVTGQSGPIPSGPSCCNGDYLTIKYGPAGNEIWRRFYNGTGNGHDVATSLVVDSFGNVYVSGSSVGSGSLSDIVVLKYNAAGTLQWEGRYNGPGNADDFSSKRSLAVDPAGNVYVTGESSGVGTSFDFVTMKYTSAGGRPWAIRYSGPGSPVSNDRAKALVLDRYRNVYVTGRSTSGADNLADFVTVKYNQDGAQQWLQRFTYPGNSVDFPNDIALDRNGNVLVSGESHRNFNPATDIVRLSGKGDFTVVKYSYSGLQLWATSYNGPAGFDDYQPWIAVDRIGNAYVTGISRGSGGTGTDVATVKYNAAGGEVWARRFTSDTLNVTNPNDSGDAIALDIFGDVYVAATSASPGLDFDYLTLKYNASGFLLSQRRYHPTVATREFAQAIAVDRSRNVYVTGSSFSTTDLDYATVKYTVNSTDPVADFDWAPSFPTENENVQFLDQSSGGNLAYAWDFNGDGITDSTLQAPTHVFPTPGDKEVTLRVSNAFGSGTATEIVPVGTNLNVPYVRSVTREYPGFFLQGTDVDNKFQANIEWKGTPGTAGFSVEGGPFVNETGDADGASHTFDLGSDFQPNFLGSLVQILPINGESVNGIVHPEKVYVFPYPNWLAQAISLDPAALEFSFGGGEVKAEIKKEYPDPHLCKDEACIVTIPDWVPYFSGQLGILETYGSIAGSVSSTGTGSLTLFGQTGFKALGGEITGSLEGSGDFTLFPPDGFALKSASLKLTLTGTVKKEVGIVQAIPQLAGLTAVPVIGIPIRWFNERAKLEGELSETFTFVAAFEQMAGDLVFKEGTGQMGLDLKATLKIDIVQDRCTASAWVAGGGSFTLGVPAPYLREVEAHLQVGAEFKFDYLFDYSAKATLEGKCSWTPVPGVQCAIEGSSSSGIVSRALDAAGKSGREAVNLIPPDFARFGGYSTFRPTLRKAAPSPRVPVSLADTTLITNVFQGASPHLVETGAAARLLLWAHQDPADPVLQSTEISWSYDAGSGWSVPALVANDTRVELSPVAGLDAAGKVVAVWTRIQDAAFSTAITTASQLPLFYTRLEVVSAVFDPATQTWGPITALTSDTALDTDVSLASDGAGNLLLTWLSNPAGEFMSTGGSPSSLKYSVWNGSSWSAPAAIATGLTGVADHAAARRGSNAFVIVPRDPNPGVTDDGVLDLYTWNGSIWSGPSSFAGGGIENRLPSVVYDVSGGGHVVWVRGDDLVHATLASPTPALVRPGSPALSFYDVQLTVNPSGNLTLLRQDSVDNGPANIFATLYDSAAGSWSVDRRLTEDSSLAHQLHGSFGSDGKLRAAYLATNILRVTQNFVIAGQTVPINNIPQDGQTDLRTFEHSLITDLAVADSDMTVVPHGPQPGDAVTVSLTVHNAGDFAVGPFEVKLYVGEPAAGGVLVGTQNVVGSFAAGDTRNVQFAFTQPAAIGDLVAVVDSSTVVTEFSESNNRARIYLTNAAPEARVLASATGGTAPLPVNFDASPSFDPNGDAITYAWTFADGSLTETGIAVAHTFTAPGTYPVTLVVTDSRGGVDTAVVRITVTGGIADLSISKSDSPDPVVPGGSVTYTVTVTNLGPAAASDVVVSDPLPPGTSYVSAGGTGWSCGLASGTVTCTRASLTLGPAPAITIVVNAPTTTGTISNTASVSSADSDPVTGNNSATATTTVANPPSPASFYTLTPCRIADTRDPAGPFGGPALAAGLQRSFTVAGRCGIPATAKAVSFNVTVTGPSSPGHVSLYPGGTTLPLVSTMNFRPGDTRANNAIIPLGAGGTLAVTSGQGSGTVHFILDTNGYFE